MAETEKLTAEEVIRNLQEMGVVLTNEPNPIGKIPNFSMSIPSEGRMILKGKGREK